MVPGKMPTSRKFAESIQGINVGHVKVGVLVWRRACDSLADKASNDMYFNGLRCKAQCFRALHDLSEPA